jgi:hypothetical protein
LTGADATSFSQIKKTKKAGGIADGKLLAIVRAAGVGRVLDAACAVEAAE